MKAMILAAGRGTRLQPLTQNIPKALVQAGGMSLLERLIRKLKVQGFDHIVINVHHLSHQIRDFLRQKDDFGIRIDISDESEALLETGGGIMHARQYLEDEKAFLVHNVDILSDLNLSEILEQHLQSDALATLAVKNRKTSRYLLFDRQMTMKGWENIKSGEKIIPGGINAEQELLPLAFSGIHVISPKIFDLFEEVGTFSIIKTYLRLCSDHRINAFRHDEGLWIDAGKPEGLQLANTLLDKA